jgi:hypothetical protein
MMEFRDVRERAFVRDEFILVLCSGRFAEQTSSAKYLAYPVLLISLAPSALADACVPMSRCEDPKRFLGSGATPLCARLAAVGRALFWKAIVEGNVVDEV